MQQRGVRARSKALANDRVRARTNRNANRNTVVTRRNSDRNFRANRNAVRKIERRRDTNRNVTVRRRGPANYAWSYNEARRRHHRGQRHDRSWYRRNYSRFALFAGGYYYWDRGYWYPAYGYDRVSSTYRFDEPIYGYSGLNPSQVIVNAQGELRRAGYYRGAIDGLIGPQTRSALARYQRDRGLYVTRAIDGPALAALSLT
ncbi:MAG: peptidoglycan-binding protein [Chthoniobacterales bacterium]